MVIPVKPFEEENIPLCPCRQGRERIRCRYAVASYRFHWQAAFIPIFYPPLAIDTHFCVLHQGKTDKFTHFRRGRSW